MNYLVLTIQLLFIPLISPLVVGWIRKCKARLQNRQGASVIQPYLDLWKLAHKDEAVSEDASWIFRFAPYVVFAVTIVIGVIIPIVGTAVPFGHLGDFIVLVSLLMLGTFFLALGGLDVGNAFGDIGSSREMTFAAITEGALLFSFIPAMIVAQSSNLNTMFLAPGASGGTGMLALAVGGVAFFIALLAENARYPFDNPSTHLELTMVHEAMIIEHSGKSLLLMEWASANKLLIFFVLAANIFFPWTNTLFNISVAPLVLLGLLLVKVAVFATVVALIESSIPKLRYFRLPELLFSSFAIGIIGIVIAIF